MDEQQVTSEEQFLGALEEPGIAVPSLVAWLTSARPENPEQADSCAELLQETLQERAAVDPAFEVLQLRAKWHEGEKRFRSQCKNHAVAILGGSHDARALVKQVGFDSDFPVAECFRRLDVVRALAPGVLCRDKTWGFGLVKSVDLFYEHVIINFDKKPEHQMSLSYAGEALELLEPDHLLARKHNDPEGLAAMIADNPAEVVRNALKSYGSMPAAVLQEVLVPDVVSEDGWKKFWEGARRGLKKDPLVDVPAKRSEPIRLLETEKSYDGAWFAALAAERHMKQVLALLEEFRAEGDVGALELEEHAVIGNRLAFVVKGAGTRHLGQAAHAVMLAKELNVAEEQVDTARELSGFLASDVFVRASQEIAARDVKRFLAHLMAHDSDRTLCLLLDVLLRLDMTTFNEAADLLMEKGREAEVAGIVREKTENKKADVEVLYWLTRHEEKLAEWSLGDRADLARWCMRALEHDHSGERLKTQNQLRSRVSQSGWLEVAMAEMSEGEQRELILVLKEHTAWPALDRRSLLGRIVKKYPDMQSVLVAKSDERASSVQRGSVTSFRSYQEKQAQLEKIISVEIPRIAREIAKARSYGDLSENHEYKAAKEMQAFLMRRRGELEEMLGKVRPSDFDGLPTDRAGQATAIRIQYPDGHEERFCILGVWDTEEKMGVISSESRLAELLAGRVAGDEVNLPTATEGEETCRIVEVSGVPDEVRAWMQAPPQAD